MLDIWISWSKNIFKVVVQSKDFGDFIITLVPNHLNLNEILNEPKS